MHIFLKGNNLHQIDTALHPVKCSLVFWLLGGRNDIFIRFTERKATEMLNDRDTFKFYDVGWQYGLCLYYTLFSSYKQVPIEFQIIFSCVSSSITLNFTNRLTDRHLALFRIGHIRAGLDRSGLYQDRSGQGMKRQDRSGQVSEERTVQDRLGQIGTVQDMTVQVQDKTRLDRSGHVGKGQSPPQQPKNNIKKLVVGPYPNYFT